MGKFDGFDQEKGSGFKTLWKPGRYGGVVVKEYETSGSFSSVHKTEDKPTQAGDSRNLKLCVGLVNGNETQYQSYTLNYRPEALTDERIEEVKAMRTQYKGVKQWPDRNAQRDNLTYVRLHELEKAGITLNENGHGGYDVDAIIGSNATFYLGVQKMMQDKSSRPVSEKEFAEEKDQTGMYNKILNVLPAE